MRFHGLLMKMVLDVVSIILLWATAGFAGFPEKPVQFLVGWPIGSTNDVVARAIAKPFSRILRQPVIVQNLPGAAGGLVLGRVKTEKPDGYTLFQTNSTVYSETFHTRPVPYDPLKDFAYLAQHSRYEIILFSRSGSPWKNFEEMIQYVKKNPKTIKYATSGVGGSSHIVMEYLGMKENLQWIHVPFNAAAECAVALMGGHVDLAITAPNTELEYVKEGRLIPLLCLGGKRFHLLPDLPTILDKGYDYSSNGSNIWSVSVKTPKEIQKILEKALLQAFSDPEVRDCLTKWSKPYDPLDSEAVTKAVTKAVINDYNKFGTLMKKLGLGIYKK